MQLLEEADLPVTPVHTLESIFEDPHLRGDRLLRARGPPDRRPADPHGHALASSPPAPAGDARPGAPPRRAERRILAEAGYGEAEIAALLGGGAVRALG